MDYKTLEWLIKKINEDDKNIDIKLVGVLVRLSDEVAIRIYKIKENGNIVFKEFYNCGGSWKVMRTEKIFCDLALWHHIKYYGTIV